VLKAEREQLERGLQSTAVTQYTAFLDAAKCLTSISKELTAVCEHLDSLLQVSSTAERHALAPGRAHPPTVTISHRTHQSSRPRASRLRGTQQRCRSNMASTSSSRVCSRARGRLLTDPRNQITRSWAIEQRCAL
jgi:hypothetical protein